MEKLVSEGTKEQIENLKKLVSDTTSYGVTEFPKMRDDYQTENLWCIDDVQMNYKCDEDEAMQVLVDALTNGATMEQVWLAIDYSAEQMGLVIRDEDE